MSVSFRTPFLDQMNQQGLIDLCLILILTSFSEGEAWNVIVSQPTSVKPYSNVTIQCSFTYPEKYHTENVEVYWKKRFQNSYDNKQDESKSLNPFIFHTNSTFVLEKYRGRTMLIGNKTQGSCSLLILNITDNETDIYMRVKGKNEPFSFYNKSINISVSDFQEPVFTDEGDIDQVTQGIYMAIFVPLSALLIIIIILIPVIVCYISHKRSHSFTREESGYYANFSRASSNQAQRESSCKYEEKIKLPELKATDEPVYVNTEAVTGQMDQSMDHTDNIYANVDYSK
ncbi:uncharacterized protein LOC108890557 [Lates calcarifer]|uniref:Uncharacterized protein LOC108890557 n=1 Tax=Lates calcarifer TaxID=8187 RepID=A0AAJ7PZV3_LATCA|nr:uncharacterized protein LOC108890557 [Lates calcarifer]